MNLVLQDVGLTTAVSMPTPSPRPPLEEANSLLDNEGMLYQSLGGYGTWTGYWGTGSYLILYCLRTNVADPDDFGPDH